jgi:hypothetical protein
MIRAMGLRAKKRGAPAWTKLITTFSLERYDIATFGLQAPP